MNFTFDNSYAQLPEDFFMRIAPTPVRHPQIAILNKDLAVELGLDANALGLPEALSILAGNVLAAGSDPIAQAYAGHQFGRFTMLGDGRAILLGEHLTPNDKRFDIQLKGSGPTPFSRRGDGRAALGPMLREYIISEAMFSLGIPTTRSLAVVSTGDFVERERSLPGAVLTRVAASHIRVGTFEYAAAKGNVDHLRALADYTIQRHYPTLATEPEPYLSLLKAVIDRQAHLITQWMHVGFIHGVMNTDNMAISGETIDYGPCAFMDRYARTTVFSSIDHQGRYAYGNQPEIAQWNLSRFAETLLPLMASTEAEAITKATSALEGFTAAFEGHWLSGMKAKLGLQGEAAADFELIKDLLEWMESKQADYTNTFRALSFAPLPDQELFQDQVFLQWHQRWTQRLPDFSLMQSHNPAVIARNHLVEEALSAASERADYSVLLKLLEALRSPFASRERDPKYLEPSPAGEGEYQTFCGT